MEEVPIMSSSAKEAKFAFLEEERRKDEWRELKDKAEKQLRDEGKIGSYSTEAEFWEQNREINTRAVEMQEREQFERLKKKYG